MRSRLYAFGLLILGFASPIFPRDWLFVTTNWGGGSEQVLLVEPDNGGIRTIWSGGAELDAITSPDAKRLYVTFIDNGKYRLAAVDTVTGAVLHMIDTPQLIRWIMPSTSGMAISSDGRWLYVLKQNYASGANEFSLLTFDTQENRFIPEETAVSDCPRPHIVPVPGFGNVRVLCDGGRATSSDGDTVLRVRGVLNFALSRGGNGYTLFTAGSNGPITALDVASHQITRVSGDIVSRYRRVMPSSDTLSSDGKWYVPVKIPNNGQQENEQVLVLNTTEMVLASVITPSCAFFSLALGPDEKRLYASQRELQNILVLGIDSSRTLEVIHLPAKPGIVLSVKAPI
jgi:hypothetical protein